LLPAFGHILHTLACIVGCIDGSMYFILSC
jgi:hypothetical protein